MVPLLPSINVLTWALGVGLSHPPMMFADAWVPEPKTSWPVGAISGIAAIISSLVRPLGTPAALGWPSSDVVKMFTPTSGCASTSTSSAVTLKAAVERSITAATDSEVSLFQNFIHITSVYLFAGRGANLYFG